MNTCKASHYSGGTLSIFRPSGRLLTLDSVILNSLPMSQSNSQTAEFDWPTLQWVVDTGRPMLEATTTVRAEANSMLKPL